MNNLAKQIKDQTDSILRRRQNSPGSSVTVRGSTTEPGTGPGQAPVMVDPNSSLATHKVSGDHDGRYYTETEVDGMLKFLGLSDTPETYEGQARKIPAVNAEENGLEFITAPPAENGIPAGGTAEQILEKIDGSDYNTQWVAVNATKIKNKPVNISSYAGKDGYILAYNETLDEWYLKADEGGGGGESSFTFFARSDKMFFAWNGMVSTTIPEPV